MISLSELILLARPVVEERIGPVVSPFPAYTLFFSICDGRSRARVLHVSADRFEACWTQGAAQLQRLAKRDRIPVKWLRVDFVRAVEPMNRAELDHRLARTKRNYFRHGIAFDPKFCTAFLEQELNANAMLYAGAGVPYAKLNERNFRIYASARFGEDYDLSFDLSASVCLFSTEGVFCSSEGEVHPLNGPGVDTGRRKVPKLSPSDVKRLIEDGSRYLARQVTKSGRFIYGYHPCFDRRIDTYNVLRHASTTYSMIEAWEVTRDERLKRAIDRALDFLVSKLVRKIAAGGDQVFAFVVDVGDEVKLGANAVAILALTKYAEVTGTTAHDALLEQLALGIGHMQDPDSGRFHHVLNASDLSVKESFRVIYYDGEAAFGLMRLYGHTQDPRWLEIVEKAFEYFIQQGHETAHDHWLSYCVNELTRYRPEERYFRFGLRNFSGYLDFVLTRETTFPTLLELMMAAEAMLQRIYNTPALQHLLDEVDLEKFYQALEFRAHHLLNGHFWPEFAMFFKNPDRIAGSFFIRHHAFRVRIDDVEHYLSGFIAYRNHLLRGSPRVGRAPSGRPVSVSPKAAGPVVAWGGDVNLGRRQHYRTVELGADKVLQIPALSDADLSVVNLECVVATKGEQGVPKGEGGPYYYRARPEMLRILVSAGIDVVSTANNHAGDYGSDALLEQAQWLDAVGIASAGSGATIDHALAPVVRRVGELNVAIFSIDTTQPNFAATLKKPGTAYLPLSADPATWRGALATRIAQVRVRAHVVLVAVHWGRNREAKPTPDEIAVGHLLVDAGADAVLGASAHRLQGVEIYRGRPIIHDAGDLLFDAVRKTLGFGGVFRLELSPNGVERVFFVPIGVGFGYSVQHGDEDACAAIERFAARCSDFETKLVATGGGVGVIELAPPERTAISAAPAPLTHYSPEVIRDVCVTSCEVNEVPSDARIEPIHLGPLTLLGYRVTPRRILKRRMLWVETFWRSATGLEEDIRLDIRAVPVRPTRMPVWGKGMDHDPCDWMAPTSRWRPGAIYRDYFGLRPPYLKDWENVELQVFAGLVSKRCLVQPVRLEGLVELAIPDKDAQAPPDVDSSISYRTDFPPAIQHCEPGQTWTAEQLQAVTGGTWVVPPQPGWFVRSVVSGKRHIDLLPEPLLFVAHSWRDRQRHEQLSTPQRAFDRHRLLPEIASRVAGAIVGQDVQGLPGGFPVLRVEDPIRAIIELGLAARQRFGGPVIAVTGTVGKSTTVRMLQQMLGGDKSVLASVDNYNSRVGVPSMLASLALDHEAAVLEVAQSALWMKRGPITRLVKPTIAVITEIQLSQASRIRSIEEVAKWKSRVFDGLADAAVAVVGGHLSAFDLVMENAARHAKRIVVYGSGSQAEVRIGKVQTDEAGSWVDLVLPTGPLRFRVPVPGEGMVRNAVAAVSALYAMGRDLVSCSGALGVFTPDEGRMKRLKLALPRGEVDLIDDSWNAEVSSMLHAISVLAATQPRHGARKVAVLGRIVHLGDRARVLHEGLAGPLLASGVCLVLTHGEEMRYLRAVLPEHVLGPHFSEAAAVAEYLCKNLSEGDSVLVKGSRRDSDFGSIVSMMRSAECSDPTPTIAFRTNGTLIGEIVARGENDFSSSRYHQIRRNIAVDLIADAAHKRGLEVVFHRRMTFEVRDGSRSAVFQQNSPGNSFVATAISASKASTKRVLARAGIAVPEGRVFNERESALAYFSTCTMPVVVKPLAGSFGRGVSVAIRSISEFEAAWRAAASVSRGVIIERFIEGDDLRVLVLGGRALAAYVRLPAAVVGNGRDTIRRLVDRANRRRQTNPRLRLSPIKKTDALDRSGRSMGDIPAVGERIQLVSAANVSLGGDIVEVTANVHPSILRAAEEVVEAIPGLQLGGVDLIVPDFMRPASDRNGVVFEINANPAIADVVFPSFGVPCDLPGQLLEFALASNPKSDACTKRGGSLEVASTYDRASDRKAFPRDVSAQVLLVRQAAHARNLRVEALCSRVTRLSDAAQTVFFHGAVPDLSGSVARHAANDTEWTREILRDAGIPGLEWRAFDAGERQAGWEYAKALGLPVVVRAATGSGRVRLVAEIHGREQFDHAWGGAAEGGAPRVLVEMRRPDDHYRFFVIRGAVVAVAQWLTQSQDNVDIEAGCLVLDVTERIHPGFASAAVRAREAVFDPCHAGIDVVAEDITRAPETQRWSVTGIDCHPDLWMHHFPDQGQPRDVAGELVSRVFRQRPAVPMHRKRVRAFVEGRVQGVGYRQWLWRQAIHRALDGWTLNTRDGGVEMVFSGSSLAVDSMLDLCRAGPAAAHVENLRVSTFGGASIRSGFEIRDS